MRRVTFAIVIASIIVPIAVALPASASGMSVAWQDQEGDVSYHPAHVTLAGSEEGVIDIVATEIWYNSLHDTYRVELQTRTGDALSDSEPESEFFCQLEAGLTDDGNSNGWLRVSWHQFPGDGIRSSAAWIAPEDADEHPGVPHDFSSSADSPAVFSWSITRASLHEVADSMHSPQVSCYAPHGPAGMISAYSNTDESNVDTTFSFAGHTPFEWPEREPTEFEGEAVSYGVSLAVYGLLASVVVAAIFGRIRRHSR